MFILQNNPKKPEFVKRAEAGMQATIAVYVPTHSRYKSCLSVLNSFKNLAELPDKIKFLVGVDDDDTESKRLADDYPIHIFKPDTITCGGRVQELAANIDADIYLATVDYYFMLTYQWDRILRHKMMSNEILNCLCCHDPNSFNFTATTKKWMKLANPVEPTLFPFWFSDQWRLELHTFVFGRSPTFTDEIKVAGNHGKTHNLHDLNYWWGLFQALRPQRLKDAHSIALAYGLTPEKFETFKESRKEQIETYTNLTIEIAKSNKANEQRFGGGEKSERYLKAKQNADNFIKEHGLTLWK